MLIRLIFLFTCQIIRCLPYRYDENVCVCMYVCVCVFVVLSCHVFCTFKSTCVYKFDKKNNCMFTNIKVEKFWTGPVSKVAHIQNLCTAAGK